MGTLNITITDEMRRQILENEISNLKDVYSLKHKQLDDEFEIEKEKKKKEINQLISLPVDLSQIKKQKKSRFWTQQEEDELKIIFGSMTIPELSKKIQRTALSINKKVLELKLNEPYIWTDKAEKLLIDLHAQTLTDEEISKKMLLPVKEIQSKITLLKNQGDKIMRKIKPTPAQTPNKDIDDFVK